MMQVVVALKVAITPPAVAVLVMLVRHALQGCGKRLFAVIARIAVIVEITALVLEVIPVEHVLVLRAVIIESARARVALGHLGRVGLVCRVSESSWCIVVLNLGRMIVRGLKTRRRGKEQENERGIVCSIYQCLFPSVVSISETIR